MWTPRILMVSLRGLREGSLELFTQAATSLSCDNGNCRPWHGRIDDSRFIHNWLFIPGVITIGKENIYCSGTIGAIHLLVAYVHI